VMGPSSKGSKSLDVVLIFDALGECNGKGKYRTPMRWVSPAQAAMPASYPDIAG
jgi:hypothetical protein